MDGQIALDELVKVSDCEVVIQEEEGLKISGMGYVRTPLAYKVPLKITAVAKTDSTNLRLHYAKGHVILNWEENPQVLAGFEPLYGHHYSVPGKGEIPKNEWTKVTWVIGENYLEVCVNDDVRYSSKESLHSKSAKIQTGCNQYNPSYRNLMGTVGIGPAWGSTVHVKAISVQSLQGS